MAEGKIASICTVKCVPEVEKLLIKEDYVKQTQWTPINTSSIIEVMGGLRSISLSKVKTFEEFCSKFKISRMVFASTQNALTLFLIM